MREHAIGNSEADCVPAMRLPTFDTSAARGRMPELETHHTVQALAPSLTSQTLRHFPNRFTAASPVLFVSYKMRALAQEALPLGLSARCAPRAIGGVLCDQRWIILPVHVPGLCTGICNLAL